MYRKSYLFVVCLACVLGYLWGVFVCGGGRGLFGRIGGVFWGGKGYGFVFVA